MNFSQYNYSYKKNTNIIFIRIYIAQKHFSTEALTWIYSLIDLFIRNHP